MPATFSRTASAGKRARNVANMAKNGRALRSWSTRLPWCRREKGWQGKPHTYTSSSGKVPWSRLS
eukprot:1636959-Lingulodinium_polyedra.AAC.1